MTPLLNLVLAISGDEYGPGEFGDNTSPVRISKYHS
jgi:hypothetical protein